MNFDVKRIRKDFPILSREVNGKPYVYFDNAATGHKPLKVLSAVEQIYYRFNGNPHRGVHYMSNETTLAYEKVRDIVQHFLHIPSREEVIFTKGTTESINLLAYSFGETFVHEGDEIVVTEMEHHSNIVPWQQLCQRKKATLKVLPFDNFGRLQTERLPDLLSNNTKLLSVTMISNAWVL